jgi:hypothetical protein
MIQDTNLISKLQNLFCFVNSFQNSCKVVMFEVISKVILKDEY